MIFNKMKIYAILILIGGILYGELRGSESKLSFLQKQLLNEVQNDTPKDLLSKYLNSLRPYIIDLLALNAKLYSKQKKNQQSIERVENVLDEFLSKRYKQESEEEQQVIASGDILKWPPFKSFYENYQNNFSNKNISEENKEKALGNLRKIMLKNTIGVSLGPVQIQQKKSEEKLETYIKKNEKLKELYEEENNILKKIIEEYEIKTTIDEKKLKILIANDDNFIFDLFDLKDSKQVKNDSQQKKVVNDFFYAILMSLSTEYLLPYAEEIDMDKNDESNAELQGIILNVLLMKYLPLIKTNEDKDQIIRKNQIIEIGKKLVDFYFAFYKKIYELSSRQDVLNMYPFSTIFKNFTQGAKNIKLDQQVARNWINNFKKSIIQETWTEKIKNQWYWVAGILGLSIFGGYKYYKYQKK